MKNSITLEQYKLIVFDIDGTLLGSTHLPTEKTKSTLKECQERNIPITLATGRNWDAVEQLAHDLSVNGPLILTNGALVKGVDGSVLHLATLPEEVLTCIIKICDQRDKELLLCIEDDVFLKHSSQNTSWLYDLGSTRLIEVGAWDSITDKLGSVQKCMVIERDTPLEMYALEKEIRTTVGQAIELCYSLFDVIEIMPKGVSKGSALLKVCAHLGIEPESVLAFGDGNNDIEMIAAAGLGVALANASALAKTSADLLVPPVDQNGPAKFLDYLLNT